MLSSLLLDPNKSVRINVANSLAAMLVQPFPNPLNQEDKRLLTEVLEEYKQTLLYQAERGFSHTNLGNLALSLNQPTQAIAHLQKAIEIEPIFMPAYINLADIYRQQGNEQKVAKVLADALIVNTESGEVHFALAMSQIRSQQKSAALLSLDKAVRYSQNNANYHYSYGLLLRDQKQANAAIKQFELAYKISPTNPDISYSLAQTYTEQGQYRLALSYAEILKRLVPNNKQVEAMVNQLKMMQSINN